MLGPTSGWDQFADWDGGQDRIDVSAFDCAGFADLTVSGSGPGIFHVSGAGGFNLNVSLDRDETLQADDFLFQVCRDTLRAASGRVSGTVRTRHDHFRPNRDHDYTCRLV